MQNMREKLLKLEHQLDVIKDYKTAAQTVYNLMFIEKLQAGIEKRYEALDKKYEYERFDSVLFI